MLTVLNSTLSRNHQPLREHKFQRAVERLHALGPRILAEFLAELAAERLLRLPIEQKIERFSALDPEVLRALEADRFPANPIRLIKGGKP